LFQPGQPGRPAALGKTRERFPPDRTIRCRQTQSSSTQGRPRQPSWRDRIGPAWCGRRVADRRLLAARPVRGGRLHPRRRRQVGRPGTSGTPGPQNGRRATRHHATSSGRSRSSRTSRRSWRSA